MTHLYQHEHSMAWQPRVTISCGNESRLPSCGSTGPCLWSLKSGSGTFSSAQGLHGTVQGGEGSGEGEEVRAEQRSAVLY